MENMVKNNILFNNIYKNKTVLVTGHTGFKGSWLCLWLKEMNAKVIGYSLKANTTHNHFELLNLDMPSIIDDITNTDKLHQVLLKYKPDIIFHLAAQPLVRYSYDNPIETYTTNILGTINLLEQSRKIPSIKAIINVTTDKVYENKEQKNGYVESDHLGGHDPYSASKACSEIVTSSYRDSFFNLDKYKKSHNTLIATCRAGNVIGGADWSEDRLIPDIIKATIRNKKVILRNPDSIRPWQHVLEPLSAYLLLGQKLLEGNKKFAKAWNIGPSHKESYTVEDIISFSKKEWKDISYIVKKPQSTPHETKLLNLDSSEINKYLKWFGIWDNKKTIKKTIRWYKNFHEKGEINSKKDLYKYIKDAKGKNVVWVN